MKKRLTIIALVLVLALALSACGCKHENCEDANCDTPKTCADCGATEGEALGHDWVDADCETAKTCSRCGLTEGEALGHAWTDADCENPKTCANCALTEGEALGHTWTAATPFAPKTCANCGLTEGDPIAADAEATAALVGKWAAPLDFSGAMLGEPGFDGTITYALNMELRDDGTMTMYFTVADISAFRNYLLESTYEEFEDQGMDKAAADDAMKESTGMTVEEYVDFLLDMLDFTELLGAGTTEGVYYVADGVIFMADSWEAEMRGDAYTLDGDTLSLNTTAEEIQTAMIFTRVE